MRKLFLVLALSFCPALAHAQSCVAASCSAANVQTAVNSCSTGGTVTIPACGSTAWATQVNIAPTGPLTIQGSTTCTGSGDPNVGSGIMSCTDNTTLSLSGADQAFNVTGTPTAFVTITGLTLNCSFNSSHGNITLGTASAHQVGFRFHHNHILNSVASNVCMDTLEGYGLIDHNYYQDTASSGGEAFRFVGDFATNGYSDWTAPTSLGSNQAAYVEANYLTWTNCNSSTSVYDGYWGPKIVMRFNTITGQAMGYAHGTETNPGRGVVVQEVYGNADNFGTGCDAAGAFGFRGGTGVVFGNNMTGTSTVVTWPLQTLRYLWQNANNSAWGEAAVGLNWTPTSANGTTNTLNAADFQVTHAYAANASVGPLTHNAGGFNFYLTNGPKTCGTYPAAWAQTANTTTTDSAGCIWNNAGGTTSAGPGGSGFCAVNPDTQCTADSTCNALHGGDTCSRFFDASTGGVYPIRDQPGVGQNQAAFPIYEWLNVGVAVPSPTFGVVAPMNSVIVANRDYFIYSGSFNGTSGVGSGTLAARSATCTTGVGYWATDQGNWNISGNGTGSGVLYQCVSTNTWSAYYTPYTYPNPLQSGSQAAAPTCDHGSGTYGGAFTNTCSTSSTGTVILCWSTSTLPVTNGSGTGCTTGTSMASGGSTTISSTETFNIVAGTSTLADSSETTYSYTINQVTQTGILNNGAKLLNGAKAQ